MMHRITAWLWERITGRPYYTVHSMAAEHGPPPAVEFAAELAHYSDAELLARGPEIVAELRRRERAAAAALRTGVGRR